MAVRADAQNQELAAHLTRLGWSPARLAHAVNAILGPGYITRTSVSASRT